MEKTKEMIKRAEGKNICEQMYEENVLLSMRDFCDEFLDGIFDFDMIRNDDGCMILVTLYVSPITSVVVDWNADAWFKKPEEFVDTMIDLYNKGQEILELLKNWKGEDSTKSS